MTAVGVLGPVLLSGAEGPVRLGSARQRRLLAALVAHLGSAIGTEQIAELVWEDPPADPAGAVQTNVARLRRVLPPGVRIATTPEGYQLLADRDAVDVTAFADHLAAAAGTDDPALRLRRLDSALRLWRGRPYAELDHPSVEPEIARLTALRAGAAEQQGAALLAIGRPGEAIAALESLTRADPLREGAVALLMRALVAAGRQSDALAAFGRLRTLLADELGLDPSPELRELEQQVLRQEVVAPVVPAPPASRGPRRVPRLPVSSFVGRDADLVRVVQLLEHSRVVTLCGPGGVGKTRLATHVAARVADRYDDGVLVVEFGDGGPADVEPLVAAALNLADGGRAGSESFVERIVEVLAVRRQLLVFDNCEHVADEVAGLVEAITSGTSAVDLLLTSREPLRADGEHVLPVPPLDAPHAALLLADRIRAGDPAAAPGPGDGALVAELCRRLDGLPLALELAAARALPLGLRGLVEAMDRPLDVLRGGRRTAAARHRSLRDVVAWSHGLLDAGQRALFEGLSVFAGPVERAAVAGVCGDAEVLPDLVERSLVVRHPGEPDRFGMLETLRAFGRSRLAADPAGPRLRARHAAWAVRLAEEIAAARRGPGEAAAVRRFDDHLADLRRAHAWLCENGPTEDLLRLNMLFGELAYLRCRIDLVRLVEEALAAVGVRGSGVPTPSTRAVATHPLVSRLLGLLATSYWQRGDLAASESTARRAIDLATAMGDPAAAREGYEALANVAAFRGELAEATRWAQQARELARQAGDVEIEFLALLDLGLEATYAGDAEAASRHEAAMVDLLRDLPSPTAHGFLAYLRGERRAEAGSPDAARHLRESIDRAEEVDSRFIAGIARHTLLTSAARGSGDPAALLGSLQPLIDHWHGFGAWTHLWMAIRSLIETLSRLDRHADAAVLLGALRASPRATPVFGADSAREHAVEQGARTALGPAFDAHRAEGAALGDAGAVALARRLTRLPDEVGQDVVHRDLGAPAGQAGQDHDVVLAPGQVEREHGAEQPEGGLVAGQDAGLQAGDAQRRGVPPQLLDQQPAHSPAVPRVDDRDGHLGLVAGAGVPDEAGDPDRTAAGSVVALGDQRDVLAPVDVEQGPAHPAGESRDGGVEAQVTAARREPGEDLVEHIGLVAVQGPDAGHGGLPSRRTSPAAGAVAALPRKRPSPTMAGTGQTVRFIEVGGRDVAWSTVGQGPPLVIGGWWMSHLELDWRTPRFRALVERLARHRTVVRYDRPGTGLSDRGVPPATELDAEVAVLAGLVDTVAAELGGDSVALFGASSGGPVAAAFTARHPGRVERLVLYGSYAEGARVAPPQVRAALVAMVSDHWGLGSRVLADVFLPGATPAERDAFARFQRDSGPAAVAARSLAAVYGFDVRAELPRITTPTLVLHRADDRAIGPQLGRELAALVPGARFEVLEGAEHFPWRGDSDAVVRAVLGFLGVGDARPELLDPPNGTPPPETTPLSVREREVLQLVAQGLADREIAARLTLSPHTVHRHIANVRTKLNMPSRSAAAAYAVRAGLI